MCKTIQDIERIQKEAVKALGNRAGKDDGKFIS